MDDGAANGENGRRHSVSGGAMRDSTSGVVSESNVDPVDISQIAERQEEALLPLKEDLAEWLSRLLGIEITAEDFMAALDNGVHVCKLAELVTTRAIEWRKDRKTDDMIPSKVPKCKSNAKSGSWFARDNMANFLRWCRDYKIKDETIFETEDLVLHKNPRSVVLCLLEIARIGTRYGIEPPHLIKLETEIEKEEKNLASGELPLPTSQLPLANGRPSASSDGSSSPRISECCSHRSTSSQSSSRPSTARKKPDPVDDEVKKRAGNCKCCPKFSVDRLSEGRYNLGGKVVFIRLLKGKHIMVRVGGGWDTFDHYLTRHDPCQVMHFSRETRQRLSGGKGKEKDNHFLAIVGKYKVAS
ncbi:growth arrest-specific protein 2-like isoform X2 [Lineus longissimus]